MNLKEIEWDSMNWTHVTGDNNQWWAVLNFWMSQNVEKLLSSRVTWVLKKDCSSMELRDFMFK
jgi:hypothetical protein